MAVLLLPIPWIHVSDDITPGTAWRLDGRLEVDGRTIEPDGRWTWLSVGRPQLVGEALWARLLGSDVPSRDLREGSVTVSPSLAEPAAAAIGLRAAGRDVPLGLIVEARDPYIEGYPQSALIVSIDGRALTNREAWEEAMSGWEAEAGLPTSAAQASPRAFAFELPDGREFTAPGPQLPYREVNTLDTAPLDLEAGISFKFAQRLPVDWFRNLSLGRSHGLMVALTTYADVSGRDIAQGRHIAGTGGIRGDGTVTRIGGLPTKARAAHRADADVMFFPASQADQLEGMEFDGMSLVPVETLEDAIDWLERPVT